MSNFARVFSAQPHLLSGHLVTVEVDISRGLNHFSIVGLPDKAVEEARDRVGSALKNSGFQSPKSLNQKTVVSLAPAELKKEGPFFDLSIAIGYLLGSGELSFSPEGKVFLGELSLNGELKPIRGALALSRISRDLGFKELFLPKENAREAAFIDGIDVFGVSTLKELVEHLTGAVPYSSPTPKTPFIKSETEVFDVDFSDIKGQETAKRGLEIAAAGGHNVAMSGPPGTGKTMLARAFASLLPPLDEEDILEITSIHSISGILHDILLTTSPFRSPHHTASYVSVIGGGTFPKPGEVTLAHKGVLFLDEFPEFDKRVIESLRQPLEDRVVNISRAKGTAQFPAHFILVAAMNPCPCGHMGSRSKVCVCTPGELARYRRKLSGPIMDRIDIWLTVEHIEYEKLSNQGTKGEESEKVRARVFRAREIGRKRFQKLGRPLKTNSEMSAKDLDMITISPAVKKILNTSAEKLKLSPRAYHRVLKLARTIADLGDSEDIEEPHILEALQYRPRS